MDAGRVFGSATGVPFAYAAATIHVEELLAGTLPSDHRRALTLEIPLFGGDEALAALQADVGSADSVFFLRNMGESARAAGMSETEASADADFYRLVALSSMIEERGGKVVLPAGEEAALAPLAGSSFADAVTRIRRAGS